MIDFEDKSAQDILAWAIQTHRNRFAIVTSFQAEGMVLLDMAAQLDPAVRVVTIDTGRLPPETYEMIETVRSRYEIPVEIIAPDAEEVASMTTRFGPNLFYQEHAYRNLCCTIRKVRPLERKVQELNAFAVGLRREQSEARQQVPAAELMDGRWKLSPLYNWTQDAVWQYLRERNVPVHPLYAQGYRSIGCAPCTRALKPGEDERAGRWWWEQDAAKECGIHFGPDGRIQRKLDVMLSEVLSR